LRRGEVIVTDYSVSQVLQPLRKLVDDTLAKPSFSLAASLAEVGNDVVNVSALATNNSKNFEAITSRFCWNVLADG
jgi:hypothetical protein